MSKQPWYRDGLRFECTQCGDCCTGAPGFVWVNKAEIEAMAARLKMDVAKFEANYVRMIGVRKSLTERANGDCTLLDPKTHKCTVYLERPRQCRTWPFWESNLRSEADWQRTCEVCPGSGQGQLVTVDQILAQSAVIRI